MRLFTLKKPNNKRSIFFTAMKKSAEIVITKGLVVLNKAQLSNCDFEQIELNLSYTEDGQANTVNRPFKNYSHKKIVHGYKVDFMKNITHPCWVNITEPTRLRFDLKGMGHGSVELNYFVIRLN